MVRSLIIVLLVLLGAGAALAYPPDSAPPNPAQAQVAALIDESGALSLPPRVERAFLLTLLAADAALRQGESSRARVLLNTFAIEVRGVKRARRLRADAADALIARAEAAIETCARR
jgi:outer membrane PBP1 activator LpoA protein